MNELVYKSEKGTPVTNSLLVAQKFEKNHKHVLDSIRGIIRSAENSAHHYYLSSYIDSLNRTQEMFVMDEIGFSILALGFTGEKAMQHKIMFVEQFFRMRQQLLQPKQFEIPQTYAGALQLAADLAKENIAITNKLKESEPKVFFADAVAGSDDSILIGKLANIIKQSGVDMGQNRLFTWMRNNGYLCTTGERHNTPTQRAMNMGLFEIKETTILSADGKNHLSITTKVTGKGQQYFVKKFNPIVI